MKKLATLALVGLMTISLTGCGGDTHESLMDEGSGMMKDMTSVLADVKDEASAKDAVSKLEAFAAKGKDLGERMKALGEPTPDQAKALMAKGMSMMADMGKFQTEMQRLQQNPELLKIIGDALKKAQGAMN